MNYTNKLSFAKTKWWLAIKFIVNNPNLPEGPTLDGSVRETYFGWLWAPLSAVDWSPGRRSSSCVAGGSGSFHWKETCKIIYAFEWNLPFSS